MPHLRLTIGGLACSVSLSLFWAASDSIAGEPIPIRKILSNLESYQLHEITLQGTISQLKPLPPYIGRVEQDLGSGMRFDLFAERGGARGGGSAQHIQLPRGAGVSGLA